MRVKDMTPEQIEKAKACKTPEEILAMVREEGIELSDKQLEAIAGGGWKGHQCPKCGSYDVEPLAGMQLVCNTCGYRG